CMQVLEFPPSTF
nr:immunoglobulin light chain junction region [Macaca mulatta]